jgi:hypothetical protein
MSNGTSGDARTADDWNKSSNEIWQDKHLAFSLRIYSQQASVFIIPCLFVAYWSSESISSHLDTSFNESKPHCQLCKKLMVLSSGFSASSRELCY